MAQKNRKCLACKTKYSFCPNCSRIDKLAPSWKSEFCSEQCMTLWYALTKFGMNKIGKSEAKEIISAIDLKPIESYASCVQRDYNKVMAEANKTLNVHEQSEQIVEIKIEQPIIAVDSVIIDIEHEVVLEEKE